MNKHRIGLWAEYLTSFLYRVRFYRILQHRYKNYFGEIDLIACRGKLLIFIEVKLRKNSLVEGVISTQQRQRIQRSASCFLAQNSQYADYDVRFDFVFLQYYKLPIIIKNAW